MNEFRLAISKKLWQEKLRHINFMDRQIVISKKSDVLWIMAVGRIYVSLFRFLKPGKV